MNKYTYATSSLVVALTLSVLPAAAAFAREAESGGSVSVQGVQVQAGATSTLLREGEARNGTGEVELRGGLDDVQATGTLREQGDDRLSTSSNRGRDDGSNATSSNRGPGDANEDRSGEDRGRGEGIRGEDESTTTIAHSLRELQDGIEQRRHELDDEAASSTSDVRDSLEHANAVRLAVHSLLASKDLLGGIGPKVSEIAREMNDSIATTTQAEIEIHSRGFFSRLFFGGDAAAADVIAQAVARNQQHIDDLNKLLADPTVSVDVQTTLKAQITALQDAQTRLQDLAQSEQKSWGVFSWRF